MYTRAPKGGCKGIDGTFYKGGQMLPSKSTHAKRRDWQSKGYQLVEPGKAVKPPYEGAIAIYQIIWPFLNGRHLQATGEAVILNLRLPGWPQYEPGVIARLVGLYNAGERWLDF